MTTTATRKTKSALDTLEALEAAHAETKGKADVISRELGTKARQYDDLGQKRNSLVNKDRGLILHDGSPNPDIADNPVAELDAKRDELGDLLDLRNRADHALAFATQAHREIERHVQENYGAILDALEPKGDEPTEAVNTAFAALANALDTYVGYCQRLMSVAVAARCDTRITQLDHAAGLARGLRGQSLTRPELNR